MRILITILLVGLCLSSTAFADQIIINNNMTLYGPNKYNVIIEPDKSNITGSDVSWVNQIKASLATKAYIGNSVFYKPLDQWDGSAQYPWASVGFKLYLADAKGNLGPYLGYVDLTLHANPKDKAGIISGVTFTDKGHDPNYHFIKQPVVKHDDAATFDISGQLAGGGVTPMPIITNAGWTSGMGNTNTTFQPGANYWVQDYGMNEPGRWTVNNGAIEELAGKLPGDANLGSRAYPVQEDAKGSYVAAPGDAYSGVWQINMKVGSNGAGPFCETFYLAERGDLEPGPANYQDGAGGSGNHYGREIDILETRWKPAGPQINLPSGGGTSWNPFMYQSQQMGSWTDVGGAPTKQFVTFGAYINNDKLWIYAYKPDGTQWYCTNAIPLNNKTYDQKGPFVPYIGTWTDKASTQQIKTAYKNFIYLPVSKLGNLNPKDNPVAFYNAVLTAKK